MNGEFIQDRWIVGMLRDIAGSRGITFESWSDDWIIELRKAAETHRVIGYRFDVNDSVASNISQDKVATYTLLAAYSVPAVEHRLVRTKVSDVNAQDLGDWDEIIIKPLVGTSGHGVRKFQDMPSALAHVDESSIQAWAAAPYIAIMAETRIVLLDGKVLLAYRKQPVRIDNLNMFNLGLGGTAVDVTPGASMLQLARDAQNALGLRLCAVDIVETANGEQRVLEVNDAVMVEHYARQSDRNKQIAHQVYENIVDQLFRNSDSQ